MASLSQDSIKSSENIPCKISSIQSEELINNLNLDPYDEEQSELRFLHSKPSCFIIVGKPGSGKTTLAQRLSMEWKCQLVNAHDVIMEQVELQTEMGVKVGELLTRGEALSEEMVAKMLEEKINSPEVAHHGYILDDFPSLNEEYMSIQDQLSLVTNWKHKPDFIINMKIPDKDLEYRRLNQRIDPLTGEIFTKDVYAPEKTPPKEKEEKEGEEEEEEEEEEEDEEEEEEEVPEMSPETIARLIRRPEDMPANVEESVTRFKDNMLRLLEDYMADHDQQYLIELDANKPIKVLFPELLSRLSCFVLRPAAVPIRLQDGEEEELPEDIDTEELMRSLGPKHYVAPRYRWRRSRWLRYCPVELAEGSLVPGKPEFAVSFLDKMYVLSSEEAMGKFLKNPRPYMLPPQPRPPCKLVITGPPQSGKTTLCKLLAEKYGATVINIEEFIGPKIEEEKKRLMDAAREEAAIKATMEVRKKIQEQMELDVEAQEAAATSGATTTSGDTTTTADSAPDEGTKPESIAEDGEGEKEESTEGEKAEGEKTSEEEGPQETEGGTTDESAEVEKKASDQEEKPAEGTEAESEARKEEGLTSTSSTASGNLGVPSQGSVPEHFRKLSGDTTALVIDADHPQVKLLIDAAMEAPAKLEVVLPPEAWVDAMEDAIAAAEKTTRKPGDSSPLHGGWIMDNFPRTREQWSVIADRGQEKGAGNANHFLPDEVLRLVDPSEGGSYLLQRWYQGKKDEIDGMVVERMAREAAEEAERKRKQAEEEAEAARLEAEAKKALQEAAKEDAEEGEEGGGDATPDQPVTSSIPEIKVEEEPTETSLTGTGDDEGTEGDKDTKAEEEDKQADVVATEESAEPDRSPTPAEKQAPPEGPELDAQKALIKQSEMEWTSASNIIVGNIGIDPVLLEICVKPEDSDFLEKRTPEEMMAEVTENMERGFKYVSWEVTGVDLDEEEEDLALEQEDEDEEEAEEEEDPSRNMKKLLGDTSYYCPMALKEQGILWPGNPEIAAKYREKNYYFSTTEQRDKFLLDPDSYLPKDRPFEPPALRLFFLGPTGAGKTVHGRFLAKKLGLFHIQWRERIQEMVIAKTKKPLIGLEAEEEEEEEEDEEDEEDESAITNPDGTRYSEEESKEKEDGSATPTEQLEEVKEDVEEEEEIQLTEDEEAMVNYLKEDEPLSTELLDKIVTEWWHKEPFKSTGFVLEGFPKNQDEAMYLQEQGLFPDAALIMVVEDTDVVGRLLPPRMDRWKAKRDRKLARRARIKEKKQKKREAAIKKRRDELVKEMEERKAERREQREAEREENEDDEDEEEEEEEEEEDDIEAQLAEEFEEEEEEEEEEDETEEEASEKMQNDLAEVYDKDTNNLSTVQEKLEELLIPRIELEAGRKPHIVRYQMGKKLRKMVEFRHSMFERVYPLSEPIALRMMQTGYKQPSRFGRWCPVKLKEGEVIQPPHGPMYPSFPALYRSYIYFLSSPAAREQFMQDPMTYLTQPSPKPVVPIRMAIIGPPKSGKTTLAKRFVEEYGCVRLSMGEAIRNVIETQKRTYLAQAILQHLHKGLTVPDELAVRALEVYTMDMRCQTRGFILDGIPITRKITELLGGRGLVPVRVIDLQLNSHEVVTRATRDRYAPERVLPLHDSAQILTVKLAAWLKEIDGVRDYYRSEHDNLVQIDAARSKWWVWNAALSAAKDSVVVIQTYVERIQQGSAASIGNMCISPADFDARLGDFEQYCPVSLALRGELVDCSTNPSLKYAVEFRGHYYKTAGPEELAAFLADPEKFVPPLALRKLPPAELLPKRRTAEDVKTLFPKQIDLQGYCPVTYKDGKLRYEALVPGSPNMVVEYRDKLYTMVDEAALQKFMRRPEDYWNLQLPSKLPPLANPLAITNLPLLGFLEQGAALSVSNACVAVGNVKPKYPFLNSTRSSLIYIAYHLKAYNPKSSEYVRKKYKRKLEQFEETCELIKYLGDNMSKKYKEPAMRPIDFDFKLDKFMALKDIEPTVASWVL